MTTRSGEPPPVARALDTSPLDWPLHLPDTGSRAMPPDHSATGEPRCSLKTWSA